MKFQDVSKRINPLALKKLVLAFEIVILFFWSIQFNIFNNTNENKQQI